MPLFLALLLGIVGWVFIIAGVWCSWVYITVQHAILGAAWTLFGG